MSFWVLGCGFGVINFEEIESFDLFVVISFFIIK